MGSALLGALRAFGSLPAESCQVAGGWTLFHQFLGVGRGPCFSDGELRTLPKNTLATPFESNTDMY